MSPCQNTIILETRNVSRAVNNSKGRISIIDSVSCLFKKGGIYNIVGPSGAGKTSFLRLLNRLDEPTSGDILFYGKQLSGYPPTELRRKIAMIFQIPYLFPGSVKENLDYCCKDKKSAVIDTDYEVLLKRVGLRDDFLNKDAGELSVGEKQRVAIARSLVLKPEIILMDEPTSALDPAAAQIVERHILSLTKELCLTAIIVTHNPEQALRMGGNTLFMVAGRLIEFGPTAEILASPKTEEGRKYVNKELV
jgi:putative ABC transport system ATP-binding protein